MSEHLDNDEILIEEDLESEALDNISQRTWKIAIVDDDEDVHRATEFSLLDVKILGRRLEFIHTYSKAETHQRFAVESNIAVVLLDVVMETEHAGLDLVKFIREDLKWQDTRIILRTGQPGYAPEEEAIRDYDINDYKTKNELTRKKLLTSLTAAIRSYEQLRTIEASRRGLHQIIASSSAFTMQDGIEGFASGVITQIAALCGVPSEGLLCAQCDSDAQYDNSLKYSVIASAGQYKTLMNRSIDDIDNAVIRDALKRALTERRSVFEENSMTLYFSGRGKRAIAAFIELPYALSEVDMQLLEVFCFNIGVCLDNLGLVGQLKNFAYRDQLLLLPNRLRFIEQIDQILSNNLADQRVCLLDIDDFAEINDVLGHRYGDLLLRSVANRLQNALGSKAFLARIGGDIFGLLGASTTLQPEEIQKLFIDPFVIDDSVHMVSMSMGVVALDSQSQSGGDVIKDASIALKRSKTMHRGSYTLFTREMGAEIRERAMLMQHLHKAFDSERLYLMYQPQVDLNTRQVLGFEALLRWRTDDGHMIPPTDFIPLAEHSGLISSLGAWVLRVSCFTMANLLERGHALQRISVNVSVIQFRQADFVGLVQSALRDSGLDARYLELEITESVTLKGAAPFEDALRKLKAMGVQISIDDFGTGYSSLSYLDRLPIDRLKIDQDFVAQIDSDSGPRIAEMVIQLGKRLDLKIIAEGVESAHHAEVLKRLRCDEGQGFYFAEPMLEGAVDAWLRNWRP